jgi:hypothetical protein
LAVEGVAYELAAYTGTNVFNNAATSSHFDRLAFSKCAINGNNAKTKYIYATATNSQDPSQNRLGYAVRDIMFDNCLISTSGTLAILIMPQSTHTAANVFESFTFTNNVFYSSTEENIPAQLFAYSGSSPASEYTMTVTISNNLFYNVATNAGWFRNRDIASFICDNNVMFAVDGSNPGGNAKMLNLAASNSETYAARTSSVNNFAYGAFANSYDWRLADDKSITGTSLIKKIQLCGASPIDDATDVATGTFVLTDNYDEYGPQPMPISL